MASKSADKNVQMLTPEQRASLNKVHKVYLKRAEDTNKERVGYVKSFNWKNRLIGVSLVLLAGGIYAYTMKAIKQENLGEEFDKRYKDEQTTT